jgi:hypothetical protein
MSHLKRLLDEEVSINVNMKDAVILDDDMMLIRLQVITESNVEYLFSTLDRLEKEWETTKLNGESYLKILF